VFNYLRATVLVPVGVSHVSGVGTNFGFGFVEGRIPFCRGG
jgi:hypothetical protein